MNKFPKYISTRLTAEQGVTLVKQRVENEFNWIFRVTPLEHDFGIDGYIDIVNDDKYITGKSIAVQIKTGKSYFKKKTSNGWEYKGEIKHLNYYLNLNLPVLIILIDEESKDVYWSLFEINKIGKNNNGWTTNIEKVNIFTKNFKNTFYNLPGLEVDYLPQLEYQWEINEKMKNSGLILLTIDKSEILNNNHDGFLILLKRLESNDEMIQKCKGKLTFSISGYKDDDIELFEIPEVRKWIKTILPKFKYWGYFLNVEEKYTDFSGMKVLHLCSVDIKMRQKAGAMLEEYVVDYDIKQTINLMKQLFLWLNEFTEKYNISKDFNKIQSRRIKKMLTGS